MMNRLLQKTAVLVAVMGMALNAYSAPTNIKNIYVRVEAYPTGAGEVYVTTCDKDKNYIREAATWGDVAEMKATLQENGSDADGSGVYEAYVSARPADGYEFLCYSYEYEEFGDIFLTQDIYKEASTENSDTRQWSPALLPMGINGKGALINVNCLRSDGNTDNPGRDNLFNSTWSETPDKYVYAVFRRIGDEYPCLDEPLPVEEIEMDDTDVKRMHFTYNLQGQRVGEDAKGIVIINGRKELRR